MPEWADKVMAMVAVLFWAGSRDTLRRYYNRAYILLGCCKESEIFNDQRTRNSHSRYGAEHKENFKSDYPRNSNEENEKTAFGIRTDGICIHKKGPWLRLMMAELTITIEP